MKELIHVSVLPQTPLRSRLPQNTEQSSMCYTVGPCRLSIFQNIYFYLFIWLHWVFVVACGILLIVAACELLVKACGIQFPDQGWNPSPLSWECGVLAIGPAGKSLSYPLYSSVCMSIPNSLIGLIFMTIQL